LYTAHDEIYLIDWDGIMLAPKERDLVFFGGTREDAFMQGYQAVNGSTLLDDDALHYYQYLWNVSEICDFGTRLFFVDHSAEQHQHDYERFDHFLNYSGIRARAREGLTDEW
jgi:spectinomycin phosphotransferase